jgi:hypothetical protein
MSWEGHIARMGNSGMHTKFVPDFEDARQLVLVVDGRIILKWNVFSLVVCRYTFITVFAA